MLKSGQLGLYIVHRQVCPQGIVKCGVYSVHRKVCRQGIVKFVVYTVSTGKVWSVYSVHTEGTEGCYAGWHHTSSVNFTLQPSLVL